MRRPLVNTNPKVTGRRIDPASSGLLMPRAVKGLLEIWNDGQAKHGVGLLTKSGERRTETLDGMRINERAAIPKAIDSNPRRKLEQRNVSIEHVAGFGNEREPRSDV